jgi:hypothetical protein
LPEPRRARILLVDGESPASRLLKRALGRHDVVAVGEQEALRTTGVPWDMILCDAEPSFYERLSAASPDLARRVVFVAGVWTASVEAFLASVPNPYLESPPDLGLLASLLQDRLLGDD